MNKKLFLAMFLCVAFVLGVFTACGEGDVQVTHAVGDTILLGSYEQDGDESNGKEPLEWIVLDVREDSMLVISRYVVAGHVFHGMYGIYDGSLSWENCDLRPWLNQTFFEEAFSAAETERILPTKVVLSSLVDGASVDFDTVTDRLFLLSPEEVETYFPTAEDRKCECSPARNQGWGGSRGARWWWMREFDDTAILSGRLVDENGEFSKIVVNYAVGIRPAMWIDTGSYGT